MTLSHSLVAQCSSSASVKSLRIVQVANGDWYTFYRASKDPSTRFWFAYRKSTNQGLTWGEEILLTAASHSMRNVSIWYDRWTPGDTTGNVIHIAWVAVTGNDVLYRNLNVSTDTLSSSVIVFDGATASGSSSAELTIVKLRTNNLLSIIFDMDGGAETGHVQAASPYTTWGALADPNEGTSDDYFALPGNYADPDDFNLYYVDKSANGWTYKTYDASLDSWSEAVLVADTGFVESDTYRPYQEGCMRLSDGMHFVFGWNAADVSTADLLGFKYDGTTLTALTNVITNSDDCAGVAVMIDQASNRLYVFYMGAEGGAQVLSSTVGIYYKFSDDDGVTWSAEQTLFDVYLDDIRQICTSQSIASLNTVPPVIWYNDDNFELLSTALIPAAAGGALRLVGGGLVY